MESGIRSYCPYGIDIAGSGTDDPGFSRTFGGAAISATIDYGVYIDYMETATPLETSVQGSRNEGSMGDENAAQASLLERVLADLGITKGRATVNGAFPMAPAYFKSASICVAAAKLSDYIFRHDLDELSLVAGSYEVGRKFFDPMATRSRFYSAAIGGIKIIESGSGNGVRVIEDMPRRIAADLSERMLLAFPPVSEVSPEQQGRKIAWNDEMKRNYLLGERRDNAVTAWEYLRKGRIDDFMDRINLDWQNSVDIWGKKREAVKQIYSAAFGNGAIAMSQSAYGVNAPIVIFTESGSKDRLTHALKGCTRSLAEVHVDFAGARLY